jgi:hypothetical protein
LNPSVAIFLSLNAKLDICRAFEELAHLFEGLNLSVIHDGFHPSIMNRNWTISVSFRIGKDCVYQVGLELLYPIPLSGASDPEHPPLFKSLSSHLLDIAQEIISYG